MPLQRSGGSRYLADFFENDHGTKVAKLVNNSLTQVMEVAMEKIQFHLLVNILPVTLLLTLMAIGMVYVNTLVN